MSSGRFSNNINTYRMVVEGFDWGPGVTALIIDLDDEVVDASEINTEDFSVSVLHQKKGTSNYCYERCPVKVAYASDANGNKVLVAASYITIQLEVSPHIGNPFTSDEQLSANNWSRPYQHIITYKEVEFIPTRTGNIMPLTDLFDTTGCFTSSDGEMLQYAVYSPSAVGKYPLIIWLHGLGEGSIGGAAPPEVALLGNRVTALVDDEIQGLMGGAHVLVPQAGTFWLDDGTPEANRQMTTTGYSRYERALTELLEQFMTKNPAIDTDRIYISGCSNGGFMTLRMLFLKPDLFAGAIPICHGYHKDWITEAEIVAIKHIPIWIVHAKNDNTLRYEVTSQSLHDRLIAAGAKHAYLTLYDNIKDQSGLYVDEAGNPHEYDGHLSWIPVFNNATKMKINGNVISIFAWLASRSRNKTKTY